MSAGLCGPGAVVIQRVLGTLGTLVNPVPASPAERTRCGCAGHFTLPVEGEAVGSSSEGFSYSTWDFDS